MLDHFTVTSEILTQNSEEGKALIIINTYYLLTFIHLDAQTGAEESDLDITKTSS